MAFAVCPEGGHPEAPSNSAFQRRRVVAFRRGPPRSARGLQQSTLERVQWRLQSVQRAATPKRPPTEHSREGVWWRLEEGHPEARAASNRALWRGHLSGIYSLPEGVSEW